MKIQIPQTNDELKCELRRRHAAGLSTEITAFELKAMTDPPLHPLFGRLRVLMEDGDVFTIDSDEWAPALRDALAEVH
jgi:hypothetical protein